MPRIKYSLRSFVLGLVGVSIEVAILAYFWKGPEENRLRLLDATGYLFTSLIIASGYFAVICSSHQFGAKPTSCRVMLLAYSAVLPPLLGLIGTLDSFIDLFRSYSNSEGIVQASQYYANWSVVPASLLLGTYATLPSVVLTLASVCICASRDRRSSEKEAKERQCD